MADDDDDDYDYKTGAARCKTRRHAGFGITGTSMLEKPRRQFKRLAEIAEHGTPTPAMQALRDTVPKADLASAARPCRRHSKVEV